MWKGRPLFFLKCPAQAIGLVLVMLAAILLKSSRTEAQTVTQTSVLTFGTAAQGAPAKTVAPGTAQNPENGSFRVDGPANQTFTIVVPAGSIFLTASGTGLNQIEISNFKAFPFPTSQTTSTGRRTIFIGATRAAIASNQITGTYSGSYIVEVIF